MTMTRDDLFCCFFAAAAAAATAQVQPKDRELALAADAGEAGVLRRASAASGRRLVAGEPHTPSPPRGLQPARWPREVAL